MKNENTSCINYQANTCIKYNPHSEIYRLQYIEPNEETEKYFTIIPISKNHLCSKTNVHHSNHLLPSSAAHHPPLFATENDSGDLCLTSSYITTAKQSPPNPDLDTNTGL